MEIKKYWIFSVIMMLLVGIGLNLPLLKESNVLADSISESKDKYYGLSAEKLSQEKFDMIFKVQAELKKEKEKKISSQKKQESKKVEQKHQEKENVKLHKEKTEKQEAQKEKVNVEVKTESISGNYMSTVELNIRKGHGLEYDSAGILKPSQKAVVSEKAVSGGITWYKVTVGNVTGWASNNYLVEYKEQPKKEVSSNKKNKETTSTSSSSSNGDSSSSGKNKSSESSRKNSSNKKGNKSSSNQGSSKKYAPNHIYYGGKTVPYQNVGNIESLNAQNVIDTTNNAATFGGTATFSGTDGMNTHFVGHNGGRNQFGGMHEASTFIVTDSSGRGFQYVKTDRYIVDTWGMVDGNKSGVDKWQRIVGTGGGERITLQSTYNHPLKWIVEAKFDKEL